MRQIHGIDHLLRLWYESSKHLPNTRMRVFGAQNFQRCLSKHESFLVS